MIFRFFPHYFNWLFALHSQKAPYEVPVYSTLKEEPYNSLGFQGIAEYHHFHQLRMAVVTILLLLGSTIMAELIVDELQNNFKTKE